MRKQRNHICSMGFSSATCMGGADWLQITDKLYDIVLYRVLVAYPGFELTNGSAFVVMLSL
jgi:hypothetical protein